MATLIISTASSISVLSRVGATVTQRIYFFDRIANSPSPEYVCIQWLLVTRAGWGMQCGALVPCSSPVVLGPDWDKKMDDVGRGWKWCMSCLRERMADAGVEPCVQVVHTVAKGQWRGCARPRMGALLPKNSRNLLVSRGSERPPHSKTRGEPAWGVHLAGTAENSGPDPKPIRWMESFQQTAGTHGTVPLLTQHISVSPQGSCTSWCSVALQVDMKARGRPSQVCPLGTHPPGASPCTVPGLWGPGVPPQAVTVALLIHVSTSTCNVSFSPSCTSQREDLASLFGDSSQQGSQRGHPSVHTSVSLCLYGKWHLHCWHRQELSRN